MKLYIFEEGGLWGDANSHPLPATVEIIPAPELGVAEIDGKPIGITGGKFTIETLSDGLHAVTVNGTPCERLLCHTSGGGVRRIAAADIKDWRSILPHIAKIAELEKAFARIENDITQKDFFG